MNIQSESEFAHGPVLYRAYWWLMLPFGIISAVFGYYRWVYENRTLGDVLAESLLLRIILVPWTILAILIALYFIFIVPIAGIAWLMSL